MKNTIKGITSIYASGNGEVTIWTRENGETQVIRNNFTPFILVTQDIFSEEIEYCEIEKLKGDLPFKYKLNILHHRLFKKSFLKHYNSLSESLYEKICSKMAF